MAVALITGASRGLGLATALHFARRGETVVAGVRGATCAGALEQAVAEEELALDVAVLDVTEPASIADAVGTVLERHGRLDIVVNNAGIGQWGAIEECGEAEARQLFETNVFGPLRLCRAALPAMRGQGSGVIVNVSSIAGRVAAPFSGLYAATKFALEAMSEALHYEVRSFGIRVAIIEPGVFATGFHDHRLVADPHDESVYAGLRRRWEAAASGLPGRDQPGDPGVVAEAVYEAATCADHPLRRLVGADAELIAQLRNHLDDAAFEHTVRTALDFWE